MPASWTAPAWEVFVKFGLPGENWTQFLPDLESIKTQGKRLNARAAQRAMAKVVKRAEVEGRTSEMMSGKKASNKHCTMPTQKMHA